MLSFLDFYLQTYFHSIHWNEHNQFSNLCSRSRSILDFQIPTGIDLSIAQHISPFLKSHYSIGTGPSRLSIGYVFSSLPISINTDNYVESASLRQEDVLIGRWKRVKEFQQSQQKAYLLYGCLFQDGRLEGLYSRKMGKGWQLTASGVNTLRKCNNWLYQMQCNREKWSGEICFSTQDSIVGLKGLYTIGCNAKNSFSFGPEVFFSPVDKSGGLALAMRFRRNNAVKFNEIDESINIQDTTFSINHMGHISSSFTTTLLPHLNFSTRFDCNLFSYDSFLSWGLEYSTKQELFKIRSTLDDIAILYNATLNNVTYSIGIASTFSGKTSLGFQIQFL